MKQLRLPILMLLFAIILWNCENKDSETQNELKQLSDSETGFESAKKGVASAFSHECDDECDVPCEENCETAFGFVCPSIDCDQGYQPVGFCFIDNGFSRWGWSILLDVEELKNLAPSGVWFDLLAAAG